MKKMMFCLLIVFSLFCLPACDSSRDSVDGLLVFLQEEDIVDENLILTDKMNKINTGILPSSKSFYIYENENSELIAINYDTNIYSKNDYDYLISIYFNVSVNEDIEYYDDLSLESYYSYSNGTMSECCKYNLENKISYAVYKSNSVFSKGKYRIK